MQEALREAEVLGDAIADLARRDPAIGHAVIAQLDAAGSTASAEAFVASELRGRPDADLDFHRPGWPGRGD